MKPAAIDPPQIEARLWEGFSRVPVGFDVGANVGQSVPHMLKFCEQVVAFEPAEESFRELEAAFRYDGRVDVAQVALSDAGGTVQLTAAPKKLETGQLVTVDLADEWGGEGDWDMTGAVLREVDAWTLDGFVEFTTLPPRFLKIDVEGHELRVLKGGRAVLARGVEMLVEVHSRYLGEQIWELLSDRYRIEEVRHPNYAEGSDLWHTHFWLKCWPA